MDNLFEPKETRTVTLNITYPNDTKKITDLQRAVSMYKNLVDYFPSFKFDIKNLPLDKYFDVNGNSIKSFDWFLYVTNDFDRPILWWEELDNVVRLNGFNYVSKTVDDQYIVYIFTLIQPLGSQVEKTK